MWRLHRTTSDNAVRRDSTVATTLERQTCQALGRAIPFSVTPNLNDRCFVEIYIFNKNIEFDRYTHVFKLKATP